jgi:hypothetical protein
MKRLMEYTVLVGLVMACLFAGSPTFLSPPSTKATIEGVVLFPSLFAMTTGSFPSMTDTHELVVPKSIPIILLIALFFQNFLWHYNPCSEKKITLNCQLGFGRNVLLSEFCQTLCHF